MGEEFDTDQLVEFCHRLGLAKDGYFDEKELAMVCSCIGLQAPEEELKELFEQLDTDHDGKVCLNELSQMLRAMPKLPSSPEKTSKKPETSQNASDTNLRNIPEFSSSITNEDRSAVSIFDPNNSGFTKVGVVLDLWEQLGINLNDGVRVLKDMGFPSTSRTVSVNVQDLTKALEEETDNSKETLPLVIQAALLTYKTETQYLRSICETIEGERNKLRNDIVEAHHRTSMLAQEVDEQNARVEQNSQLVIQKIEAKYLEQIHDIHAKYSLEKESLQQMITQTESKLKTFEESDLKLKASISKLKQENLGLEVELRNLNKEIRDLNKVKASMEKEISRYIELDTKLIEMEKHTSETVAEKERNLQEVFQTAHDLQDRNDELTSQLATMKETIKVLKAISDKKQLNKKRKGSKSHCTKGEQLGDDPERNIDSPLEKMSKLQSAEEDFSFYSRPGHTNPEAEDTESALASCSQPDSGNFPEAFAINLAACFGESCTDLSFPQEVEMDNPDANIEDRIRIDSHIKYQLRDSATEDLASDMGLSGESFLAGKSDYRSQKPSLQDNFTQTDINQGDAEEVSALRQQIQNLEDQIARANEKYDLEKKALQDQCKEYEESLELLRTEYDKCEDYWHEKLQEARDIYEQDRIAADEKFQDVINKIKEYEESFLQSEVTSRLPPIEERASLEKQVTDLEEECQGLRKELQSVKVEQDSTILQCQREIERKALEECNRLEQQVSVLNSKCKEYESRLSSLAEQERSTVEESGMNDLLRDRIRQLEYQLKEQEETHRNEINHLQKSSREKDEQLKRITPESLPSVTPPSCNSSPVQWTSAEIKDKSKVLLQLLQPKEDSTVSLPTSYSDQGKFDKSSSLPYIPYHGFTCNTVAANMWKAPQTNLQELWLSTTPNGKKAWCHVELGWLQALRSRLKQREEQCCILQRQIMEKELEMDRRLTELDYQHKSEITNWENLMQASQELVRQHAIKHKEQAEKLAHSEMVVKELWLENAKLVAALNTTEKRVMHLESMFKYQVHSTGSNSFANHSPVTSTTSSPRSLQFPPHHFTT